MATRDPARFGQGAADKSVHVSVIPPNSTKVEIKTPEPVVSTDTATTEAIQFIGSPGLQGIPGKDGKDGKDGIDGRDGIDGSGAVHSVNTQVGDVILTAEDIGAAPIDSPGFTGIPTAPTPSVTDFSEQVATTQYVQSIANGHYIANVSGGSDVGISVEHYQNKIFTFTGELVADITVFFPPMSKQFMVENKTTGPHTLTLSTGLGQTLRIGQNMQQDVYTDGMHIRGSSNEFNNVTISDSTATTPDANDNSNKIATTKFVKLQNYITLADVPVKSVLGRTGDVMLQPLDIVESGVFVDGGTF